MPGADADGLCAEAIHLAAAYANGESALLGGGLLPAVLVEAALYLARERNRAENWQIESDNKRREAEAEERRMRGG